jgi:hypothetical protein
MVPVHHSTFVNSIDPPDVEVRELARLVSAQGLGERVQILAVGQQRVLVPRPAGTPALVAR